MVAALAIVLTGPLLLFNPWLVSAEQARHGVAASLQTDQANVERVTSSMLGDLFVSGDFAESIDGQGPILDASERSHMQDVGGLVRVLAILEGVALIALIVTWRWLRNERERRGRLLLRAAAGVGAGALVLAAFFALSFETAFAAFHALFFKSGTWQFSADSNLIRLFPEPFWFEVSLLAGASILLSALLAAWLARRDLGSAPAEG
ncbi:MAG: lipoprotein intramolecular transacylase Lit [Candidatus Limnocylindria bacterium]